MLLLFGSLVQAGSPSELRTEQITERVRKLADISPINYVVAQGQEHRYGYMYTPGTGISSKPFEENKYFRMTAGKDPGLSDVASRSSEKITMTAEDIMGIKIQIGDGKVVKFGSEEFFESTANRFVQSFVHNPGTEGGFVLPETINVIFNPKGLSQGSYEDLANQVIGAQVRRFETTKGLPNVPSKIKQDFDAIAGRIFGKSYDEASQDLARAGLSFGQVFAEDTTLATRAAMLTEAGMGDQADELARYVSSVATEIKDDGIAAFKYMGEAAEDIRAVQRMSGNEALIQGNDELTRDIVSRATSVVTVEDEGRRVAVGMTMSPFSSETATKHTQVAMGAVEASIPEKASVEIAEAARAFDVDALTKLEEAIPLVDNITEGVGVRVAEESAGRVGQPVADAAIKAGRQFVKNYKTGIYLAGLAAATAVIGKKALDKREENQLYDRTMDTMPAESGDRPYGIQDAMFARKTASRRKDPLVTAGVVGNLDRNKVGHTSMGPDKNNHLFGG